MKKSDYKPGLTVGEYEHPMLPNYRITQTKDGWQVEPANTSKNYQKLLEVIKELPCPPLLT